MDEINDVQNESETGYTLDDLLYVAASITREIKEIQQLATEFLERKRPKVEPEWLNSYDTRQKLRICKRTLQRYRDTGLLSYTIFNGNIRYRYADVVKLLKK